jgi:fimbrial chaperone protein
MMRWEGVLFGLTASIVFAPAEAADIRVTPVRIVLSTDNPISSMHIENNGTDPVLMQLSVVSWSQNDGQDLFAPTNDILGNPPQFRLPAGADQIVRFGLQTTAGTDEKSYRVFVDQVPQQTAPANGVQTVLRISVPIFVPGKEAAAKLQWDFSNGSGHPVLRVTNSGNAHAQIERITLSDNMGQLRGQIDQPAYILPGQFHVWTVQSNLLGGEQVHLHADSDIGPIDRELVLKAADNAPDHP